MAVVGVKERKKERIINSPVRNQGILRGDNPTVEMRPESSNKPSIVPLLCQTRTGSIHKYGGRVSPRRPTCNLGMCIPATYWTVMQDLVRGYALTPVSRILLTPSRIRKTHSVHHRISGILS